MKRGRGKTKVKIIIVTPSHDDSIPNDEPAPFLMSEAAV